MTAVGSEPARTVRMMRPGRPVVRARDAIAPACRLLIAFESVLLLYAASGSSIWCKSWRLHDQSSGGFERVAGRRGPRQPGGADAGCRHGKPTPMCAYRAHVVADVTSTRSSCRRSFRAGRPRDGASVKSQTMKTDADEKELLESVERGDWKSAGAGRRERTRYARYAKATFRKDRRLNIRLSSKDLEAIPGRPRMSMARGSFSSSFSNCGIRTSYLSRTSTCR